MKYGSLYTDSENRPHRLPDIPLLQMHSFLLDKYCFGLLPSIVVFGFSILLALILLPADYNIAINEVEHDEAEPNFVKKAIKSRSKVMEGSPDKRP